MPPEGMASPPGDQAEERLVLILLGPRDLLGGHQQLDFFFGPFHLRGLQDTRRRRAENSQSFSGDAIERWQDIEPGSCFRYVSWIGARGLDGPRHAPPLRMRLRCWYEVVIGTAKGRRIVLREEGPRDDAACTTSRAIGRWRKLQGKGESEPISIREFRIAKRQPRPMPTDR